MNRQLPPLLNRIIPIISLIVFLILLFFGLVIFAYLFIFAGIIFSGIYLIVLIKKKFFTPPQPEAKRPESQDKVHSGRTFDHDNL